MKWEQLVKGQAKDYKFFLTGYKQSLDQLNADIVLLLGQHTEKTAPQNVRDKIARDRDAWETLWGINGQKIDAMRAIHQKEIGCIFCQSIKLHFMSLEKLEARHQKELKDYYSDREKRLNDLLADQKELISNCIVVSPKTHDLLKNLLQEQRNIWEEWEREELNMLKHMHTLERGSYFDKQAKREELAALLSKAKDRAKDQGR